MNILAIESSCDETACAVIKDGTEIVGSAVASSTNMHEKWGGIVPEVAAREQLSSIIPVITEALSPLSCHPGLDPGSQPNKENLDSCFRRNDIQNVIQNNIDAIAVTVGPGLIGSLLIGVEAAKTIAFITKKPIIPVNHVLAHMYANFIDDRMKHVTRDTLKIIFPAISLVVSGGHTELFLMNNEKELTWLGGTIDDAAGEAFDKTARLLGFGHGGGRAIEEASKLYRHPGLDPGSHPNKRRLDSCFRRNDKERLISLPRPMMYDGTLNFSFSGLKTAVMREVNKMKEKQQLSESGIQQLAFEVQEAITDVLVDKTVKAAEKYDAKSIMISGGVASNTCLRKKFIERITSHLSPITFHSPPIELCTDNAAFIGSYAFFRGTPTDWHEVTAIPDMSVEE